MTKQKDLVVQVLIECSHLSYCNWWQEQKDSTPCTCGLFKAIAIAKRDAKIRPLIDDLIEYGQHESNCPRHESYLDECFCGFSKLLSAIDEAQK